jgi:phosphoribosylformimino-5-aminoimidazole carboxamide ribotide isomerase
MLIIAAIDIINGKCVRLTQGNYAQKKIYYEDPVDAAKQWERQGAHMIHIIDLDGAKNGSTVNLSTIKRIVQSVGIPVQAGGGIRNKQTVQQVLSFGVSRVIIGTTALENEEELKRILADCAPRVAVALDVRNNTLMTRGWLSDSSKDTFRTAQRLEKMGVVRFIYTDVVKDGTLTVPNYKDIARLTRAATVPVIAAGGISTIAAIKKLKKTGVEAAVIGKAIYEGKLSVKEAVNAC